MSFTVHSINSLNPIPQGIHYNYDNLSGIFPPNDNTHILFYNTVVPDPVDFKECINKLVHKNQNLQCHSGEESHSCKTDLECFDCQYVPKNAQPIVYYHTINKKGSIAFTLEYRVLTIGKGYNKWKLLTIKGNTGNNICFELKFNNIPVAPSDILQFKLSRSDNICPDNIELLLFNIKYQYEILEPKPNIC